MSKYPIESFYRATLTQSITAALAVPFTVTVSETPVLTTGFLTFSPNTVDEEIMYYSARDSALNTITISKRGVSPTANDVLVDTVDYNVVAMQKKHSVLDIISADINNIHLNTSISLSDNNIFTGNNTFSGSNTFSGTTTLSGDASFAKSLREPVYADSTARDAAITSPLNGMVVYNTAAGLFQKYQAGSWEDDTAGGTTPNGSTTVAGKYELATQTENDNGTTTGATGATLVASPTLTALTSQKGIQTYATASGTNTYSATLAPAVAALTDGMEVRIKFTNANNSSTVTLNLNGIGAANVIRHNAGNLFIGDISAGMVGILIYSSGLSGWLLKNPALDGNMSYFGNGEDGDVTLTAGTTTLTSDMFYNNLTIDVGATLNPSGYKVFVYNTLTNNGVITRPGNNGGNGANGVNGGNLIGGGGGAGSPGGLIWIAARVFNNAGVISSIGGNGGNGGVTDHVSGGSIATAGGGAAGAAPNTGSLGADIAGAVGEVAGANQNPAFTNTSGSAGGGAGGYAGGTATRGSNYNLVLDFKSMLARFVSSYTNFTAFSTVSYKTTGQSGGGSPDLTRTNNGGGGGGGNGGVVLLVYKTLTALGTITLTGGSGGVCSDNAARNGTAGSAGSTIQIAV